MEPKTKLQKEVVALSKKLPKIGKEVKLWAYEKCFKKYAVRSRKTLFCLECGHIWKNSEVLVTALTGCTCPKCKSELELYTAYSRTNKHADYFAVLTTAGGMQVIRMFYLSKSMKKLRKAEWFAEEVMQHWIGVDGKVTTMSLNVMGLSSYYDQWIFGHDLQVRPPQYSSSLRYGIRPSEIYPKKQVLPIIRRNGFRGSFYNILPPALLSIILTDSWAETLLKAGQTSMLSHYITSDSSEVRSLWPSIKICIRNNYKIKDSSLWLDYVHLLHRFGKDIRSSFYVCPENLNKVHDRYVSKKQEMQRRDELAALRSQIEANQKEYEKKKKRFFGLLISDGDITISSLDSVEEFMIEGDALGHCLFTNEYFKRDDSLILSAKKDNQRLETVEVSLKSMEVLQSRGAHNKNTRYHDKIVSLVKANMSAISDRARKPKKEKAVA